MSGRAEGGDAAAHHLEVARTARYWSLGDDVAAPKELWIVLHGYKQLARRFLRRFQPLADGTRRIVAPEGLSLLYADSAPGRHGPTSVVGASWMTREDREAEISDYVRYLDILADRLLSTVRRPPERMVVVGFSQGVATACRWTVLGRVRPQRVLLWGDFVPPDLPWERAGEAWSGVDVVRVRGDRDLIFADTARGEAEEEALARAGVTSRIVRYQGGHDIEQRTLQALAAGEA